MVQVKIYVKTVLAYQFGISLVTAMRIHAQFKFTHKFGANGGVSWHLIPTVPFLLLTVSIQDVCYLFAGWPRLKNRILLAVVALERDRS